MSKKSKSKSKEYMERDFSCGTLRIYPQKKRDDFFIISLECGFAITGNVKKYDTDEEDDIPFLAYHSYKNKKGEYVNTSYCFNKDVIEELNEILQEMY